MFGWWDEFLEEVLPTKWLQRIAATTPPLSLGALWLPDALLKIELLPAHLVTPQIRLLLALSVLCIGLAMLLALSLNYAHDLRKKLNKPKAIEKPVLPTLDVLTVDILAYIGNVPRKTNKEISALLNENPERVKHRLESLQEIGLADCYYHPAGPDWYATPAGRTYMEDHGLFVPKRER